MEQTFKLRKSKKFKNLCAVALLTATLGGTISYAYANESHIQAVAGEVSGKQKSQYLNGEALINNKQTIDTDITLEDGTVDNQNYRLVSWKKNGPYKLQTASNPINEAGTAWLPASVDNIKNEAKRLNTPILTTGGFWSYNRIDSGGPAKEIANGRTGYLVSDGNNNVQAKEYNPNESIVDMMKTEGSHGWNVGAFGAIVKDGKIVDGYGGITDGHGGAKAWKNDPNEKNGRTIFLELNDGTQSILTIDGHTSKKTGVDHDQIVQILKNIGLDKIKLAFALDGGGSTRSYAKTDSGNESIVGSFVDNRPLGEFLYLTKNPSATPGIRTEKDANKVAKNESKSVDYNMFIEARNAGKEKIPGTNYDTGITYKDETKTDKVPFTTIYKANPNVDAGKKSTIQKGEDGVVTTKVTTKYVDGVKGDSKSGTPETTKQTKDEVVEVGTKTKVETKTIPFERVTRDNDQLKQGETKIVQAGKDGKQTVTTAYELNTRTGEVTPKETTQNEPMTPEIVERGTMKPVETTPSETKPSETKPSETKPSETKLSETKPSETKPSETPKSSDKKDETKPSETKPSETKPSETPKSSDKKDKVKPSETPKSSDKKDETKPSETKPSDKKDEVKPSETPKSSDKKDETKPSETPKPSDKPKPSETKPSDKPKSSDKKDETKPSEVKPSETPKSSDKKDETKPSETKPSDKPKPSDKKDETKPSETPKASDKKDETKPSETPKSSDKKDDVKPSETKKSDESKSSENSNNNKSDESKPELTDNSDNSKANKSIPESKSDGKSDVKPELTDNSKSSDNLDKPEANKSIPESKSEVKPDVKPDVQSSSLDNKSANSSASQSAQNSSKQDLPKTNDVKIPLTISGIVLATAGFVALGYRKFFGKN